MACLQGCNSALEDCEVLDKVLEQSGGCLALVRCVGLFALSSAQTMQTL